MADSTMDDKKFNKIFAYICGSSLLAFIYIFAITFVVYPESKSNVVMIILGFLLGNVIGSGIGFLLSGNPDPKKVQGTPPTTVTNNTGDINVNPEKKTDATAI